MCVCACEHLCLCVYFKYCFTATPAAAMLLWFSILQHIPSLEIIIRTSMNWITTKHKSKISRNAKSFESFLFVLFRQNEKQKEELCVCVCTWMHMPLCTVTLLMLVTHLDKLCLLCWLWRFEIMNRYVNIFDYASIQTKTKRVVRSVGFFCCDDSWSCLCGVLS